MSLTIVKAACKHRFNGWTIEGYRHWDDEMRRQKLLRID